jgi:hypothetical protein
LPLVALALSLIAGNKTEQSRPFVGRDFIFKIEIEKMR